MDKLKTLWILLQGFVLEYRYRQFINAAQHPGRETIWLLMGAWMWLWMGVITLGMLTGKIVLR